MNNTRIKRIIPSTFAIVLALGLTGLTFTGCGGGGSGGNEPGVGGVFRVVVAEALPNGRLMPDVPNPPNENQVIMVEFSKGVDPATLFDHTTTNGVGSGMRLINHFYEGQFTTQNPPTSTNTQTSQRLEGFLVWNGQTNFDETTGTFRPLDQMISITAQDVGINDANYKAQTNVIYFVADKDKNPKSADSFLPSALNTATLKASQIQLDCQTMIKSHLRGEALDQRFGASFNVGTRDFIFPRIDTVDPVPDQSNVDVNSQITVRFTEAIEASTAFAAPVGGPTAQTNFLVEALIVGPTGPVPVQVDGTISPSSGSTFDVVFTPQTNMPGNTVIKVTITSGTGNYIDLSNNELAQTAITDGNYTFTTGVGPQLANNPVAPQVVHFLTQNSEMGAIETVEYDDVKGMNEDFYVPLNEKGTLRFPFPGHLLDIEFGPFIAPYFQVPGSGANVIGNPPVQNQYLAINMIQGNAPRPNQSPPPDIHIWTPPGTSPDNGLCNVLVQPFPPPVQPVGNFLFVSNEEKDVIHVINSNTFQHYTDFKTPDPRGLAMDPVLAMLFVTNFGANSVSVLDLNPDPITHYPSGKLIRMIPVGSGPDAITVSAQGEDVLVVNRLENTASVIGISKINSTNPVRLILSGNIGPECVDVCSTGRIPALPPLYPTLPWYAYFCNLGADNVSVFEGGPQQISGYGRDNIIQVVNGFPTPTALNSDEMSSATAVQHEPIDPGTSLTGCWVTCGDGTVKFLRASRFKYSQFPNPPPSYIGVDYEIASVVKVGARPKDVVVRDPFVVCQTNNHKAAPDLTATGMGSIPARIYVVNGDGTVSIINLAIGKEILRLPGIGISKLAAYYTN
jgi:hypothetical protein